MKNFTPEQKLIIDISKNIINLDKYIPSDTLLNNIDWEIFYELIIKHKIFQISYRAIKKYIPYEFKDNYNMTYVKLVEITDNSIKELENIYRLANDNNIKVVIMKGITLSKIIYNDIYLREYGDIDILLEEKDIMNFRKLMNSIDFFNTYMTTDNIFQLKEPSPTKLGVFHEYIFSKKVNNSYVFTELKLYTSAIRKKFINDFLLKIQYIKIKNFNILANNLTYVFLHLCANTYGNSERRFNIANGVIIRDYIDIYTFLKKYNDKLDWLEIQHLSNKYNILHEIYCTFYNLFSIYDKCLSDEVIELFNPKNSTYKIDITEYGSVVEWSSDFAFRLFNDSKRIEEYEYLYYLRGYSKSNANINNPIILRKYSNLELNDLDNYIEMKCSNDSDLTFKYKLLHDDRGINILLHLTKVQYEIFKNIRLDFNFFYNPQKYKDYVKIVNIYMKDNKLFYKYNGNEHNVDEISISSDNIILKMNINFSYIGEGLDEMDNKLCYNIYVFEDIYPPCTPILIGLKYHNSGDPEETSNLGVLQLNLNE